MNRVSREMTESPAALSLSNQQSVGEEMTPLYSLTVYDLAVSSDRAVKITGLNE